MKTSTIETPLHFPSHAIKDEGQKKVVFCIPTISRPYQVCLAEFPSVSVTEIPTECGIFGRRDAVDVQGGAIEQRSESRVPSARGRVVDRFGTRSASGVRDRCTRSHCARKQNQHAHDQYQPVVEVHWAALLHVLTREQLIASWIPPTAQSTTNFVRPGCPGLVVFSRS